MPIGLWLLSLISFLLEIIVLTAVVRGRHYRRFPLVLTDAAFGAVVIVVSVALLMRVGYNAPAYERFYWIDDILVHGLIVILLLTLLADAARVSGKGMSFVLILAGAVVVFAFGSLAYYYEPSNLRWMTALSRNLSFCEAVLNFILWGALIRNRTRDTLLLMVSAGIGLQVTGEVIGNTLRLYAPSSAVWLPDMLVVGSEMLCLLIWIYAFWNNSATPRKDRSAATPAA